MEKKLIKRENTRAVTVGNVIIGGGSPISIQSMTNTDTKNVSETVEQILKLENAGCEIIRVAVPDNEAAEAIKKIKKGINIPLVADVHFDYRLALLSIQNGADKLRINPGNIGDRKKIKEVANSAKAARIPIRIGVNGGSLEKDILKSDRGVTGRGLAESALSHIAILEDCGFFDIVVSVKTSDIHTMLEACRILAEQVFYPLHIGLTEAGTPYRGAVRSAVGLGLLLQMGIGDTIRVSLTGEPVNEIHCGKEILQAMGLRTFGPRVVSCPTCGRTQTKLVELAEWVEAYCENIKKPMTIAVMGCAVNGPGEAREADIGIACGRGEGVLFRKGQIIKKIKEADFFDVMKREIENYNP